MQRSKDFPKGNIALKNSLGLLTLHEVYTEGGPCIVWLKAVC